MKNKTSKIGGSGGVVLKIREEIIQREEKKGWFCKEGRGLWGAEFPCLVSIVVVEHAKKGQQEKSYTGVVLGDFKKKKEE